MKVTGYKCDVCPTMSETTERPDHWLLLKLPGGGSDANKDFCSDRCLLFFAKQRVGGGSAKPSSKVGKDPALASFLDGWGVTPAQRGPLMSKHVRARHEMGEPDLDCLICQFLDPTRKGSAA